MEHCTNDWVRNKISYLENPQEPLLATVKRRKLAWFGHVTRVTASAKQSFRTPWGWMTPWSTEKILDDAREWTSMPLLILLEMTSHKKKKTGRGSLLSNPSYPSDDPTGGRTELN